MTKARINPFLLGVLIGIAGCSLLVLTILHDPSLATFWMANVAWGRFIAYTISVFVLLVMWPRFPRTSLRSWGLILVLLLIHTAFFALFILRVRPLGSLHYILFGPIELVLLAWLLRLGMALLRIPPRPKET